MINFVGTILSHKDFFLNKNYVVIKYIFVQVTVTSFILIYQIVITNQINYENQLNNFLIIF
jgi:hypothetical protein